MTAPVRVAYITLSRQAGGAERQMLTLAERLPRDRFAPELIAGVDAPDQVERARRAGIPVRSLDSPIDPMGHTPSSGQSVIGAVTSRAAKGARLVRTVRAARYDILDAWLYPADVAMALIRPIVRMPIVLSGRRNIDPHTRFGLAAPVVESLANRLTDTVVANCQAAADHAIAAQHVRPEQVRIIRNGVAIPDPISVEERTARRRELAVDDDAVIIGCVASYTPAKRLDRLVAAFAMVARERPRARLELVGEGPGRTELEWQVRSLGLDGRVCLHGYVREPERWYPAFDLVALSSEREGLPNTLLEAAAAGTAAVATAVGGTVEVVVDGETGLLVPNGDGAALASALERLIDDVELRRRLGGAARERAALAFGMDRFVGEFAALYEARIGARRHRR